MNTINSPSHCQSKREPSSLGGNPSVAQTAPAGGASGGTTFASPTRPGNSQSLANTMVASRQLNSGWQGRQDGRLKVAVIDDFQTGADGFNHGREIDGIVRAGGATASGAIQGASPVETVQFNINNGGNRTRAIADSLDQIAQRAARGEQFDAVNISQQDFADNADTAAVRQKIDMLQRQFGIPVVVAAGNNSEGVRNALAGSAAFVVENSVIGGDFRTQNSAGGNVRSEGRFTSQATANVTARVAQLHDMGYSFSQIQEFLLSEASSEGGSLDGPRP